MRIGNREGRVVRGRGKEEVSVGVERLCIYVCMVCMYACTLNHVRQLWFIRLEASEHQVTCHLSVPSCVPLSPVTHLFLTINTVDVTYLYTPSTLYHHHQPIKHSARTCSARRSDSVGIPFPLAARKSGLALPSYPLYPLHSHPHLNQTLYLSLLTPNPNPNPNPNLTLTTNPTASRQNG
jgi:hypothetical protein